MLAAMYSVVVILWVVSRVVTRCYAASLAFKLAIQMNGNGNDYGVSSHQSTPQAQASIWLVMFEVKPKADQPVGYISSGF
jgi:hypothetical protein